MSLVVASASGSFVVDYQTCDAAVFDLGKKLAAVLTIFKRFTISILETPTTSCLIHTIPLAK